MQLIKAVSQEKLKIENNDFWLELITKLNPVNNTERVAFS